MHAVNFEARNPPSLLEEEEEDHPRFRESGCRAINRRPRVAGFEQSSTPRGLIYLSRALPLSFWPGYLDQ